MYLAVRFSLSNNVTASAESVDGPTPAARVTWSTTVPPECVASVTVEFRTSSRGDVEATHNTTNTSQTEVIQTDLQCTTNYHITVVVTGVILGGIRPTKRSNLVQVPVGGKEIVCMRFDWVLMVVNTIAQIYQPHLE